MARAYWIGVLTALLGAHSACGVERNVLAHGAGRSAGKSNPIWLAVVEAGESDSQETRLLVREGFGETLWKEAYEVPVRYVELTAQAGEAVLVERMLSQPQRWARISPLRFTQGEALPGRGEIVAMAGGPDSIWALGRGAALPATRRATADPGAGFPLLYENSGGDWVAVAASWPNGIAPGDIGEVSMAVIGQTPWIAVRTRPDQILVLEYANRQWVQRHAVPVNREGGLFAHKLLNLDGRPGIWLQPNAGVGGIWTSNAVVELALGGEAPAAREMDLTIGGEQIRLLYRKDGGLYEQRYAFNGSPDGPAAELKVEQANARRMEWVTIAVLAVVCVLVLNALLRRRAAMAKANEERDRGRDRDQDEDE